MTGDGWRAYDNNGRVDVDRNHFGILQLFSHVYRKPWVSLPLQCCIAMQRDAAKNIDCTLALGYTDAV